MKHPVDEHVGKRLRHRRWMLNMTQSQLADLVGIKFQQVQKYETAANRVSASRLWEIAQAMNVPVSFFFDGLGPRSGPGDADILGDREAMELARIYRTIPEMQRKQVFELLRVLGQTGP